MRIEDAEALRNLVQSRSGVVIDPAKTYLVETRLGPLARREGFPSHDELLAAMRAKRDDRLIWAVTEAMTSSETAFFRDRDTFDAIRQSILPKFAGRTTPVKIWSAACAGGQEPYSLAMMLEDEAPRLEGAAVELFASDLSEACLEKARSGLYSQFEVQRGLPIRSLIRHFSKQGEMWRISAGLMAKVRWRRINLLADLAPLGRFDMIFCRYVVGSFDAVTRRRVIGQLKALLTDDGYLVLGQDETAGEMEGLHPVDDQPGIYTRHAPQQGAAAA